MIISLREITGWSLAGALAVAALMAAVSAAATETASEPAAWRGVTVVLADGWRYRDVEVHPDRYGAGLWIRRADGAERLVPAEAVASIHDADGRDVTAAVLGAQSPPPASSRPPGPAAPRSPEPGPGVEPGWDGALVARGAGDARVGMPAATGTDPGRAPLFAVALGAEAGFATGEGAWYEGFEPAWGVGGRLRLTTHERTYLGLGVRHQTLGVADVLAGGGVDVDTRLLVIEGTIGWISGGRPGASRAYLELGAAMIDHEITVAYEGAMASWDETAGAFVGRVGVLVPVGGNTAIDLGGTWYYKGLIFAEDEPAGSLLGLQAGLTWFR